jgi:hypothetical protein
MDLIPFSLHAQCENGVFIMVSWITLKMKVTDLLILLMIFGAKRQTLDIQTSSRSRNQNIGVVSEYTVNRDIVLIKLFLGF